MRIKVSGDLLGRKLRAGQPQKESLIAKGDYSLRQDDQYGMNTFVLEGEGRTYISMKSSLQTAKALGWISFLPEREPETSKENGLTDSVTEKLFSRQDTVYQAFDRGLGGNVVVSMPGGNNAGCISQPEFDQSIANFRKSAKQYMDVRGHTPIGDPKFCDGKFVWLFKPGSGLKSPLGTSSKPRKALDVHTVDRYHAGRNRPAMVGEPAPYQVEATLVDSLLQGLPVASAVHEILTRK